MIAVTATQAARSFANILDAVEHGETVVITRDGVPVGRLVPERRTSADRLKAALRDSPADAGFADELERGERQDSQTELKQVSEKSVVAITELRALVGQLATIFKPMGGA